MFLLIDNYDSFTYNLAHYFGDIGAEVEVVRNDVLDIGALLSAPPAGIIISPGPCDPDRAGQCLELIEKMEQICPIFGVCLGFQVIVQHFGGRIIRANKVMHGKTDAIHHENRGVFTNIPSPLTATRYHSLIAEKASFPDVLNIDASVEDGTIMAISHQTLPIFGVQFHPESIATEHGHMILRRFTEAVDAHRIKKGS